MIFMYRIDSRVVRDRRLLVYEYCGACPENESLRF